RSWQAGGDSLVGPPSRGGWLKSAARRAAPTQARTPTGALDEPRWQEMAGPGRPGTFLWSARRAEPGASAVPRGARHLPKPASAGAPEPPECSEMFGNVVVSPQRCMAGRVTHSSSDQTWSARPAAIAGVLGRHRPPGPFALSVRTGQQKL